MKKVAPVTATSPKVDAYLASAPPFAQPILTHLRQLVHKGCPEIEEAIKWSHPFFLYRGVILFNMAAFKQHCSFGLWGTEIRAVLHEAGVLQDAGMGSLGRILRVEDLPANKLMLQWIRQSAALVESGEHTSPFAARNKAAGQKAAKPSKLTPNTPAEFASALKKDKKASANFAAFSPSGQREYIEWVAEAKRPETRDRRIATAVEWIAEGKQRNWKYQAG